MSYDNPTPLRIGAEGALHGWRVRVAGRIVMGMDDGGETYYWNEFNLIDEGGHGGTLVYEETDDGPEWKLFTTFEPRQPMTAREAAAQRVGSVVNLDANPTKVTLVDQSRVYHIEGEAPEGVEVGDVANYFNADAGERMLVASWTGDEIEFYEGRDLRADEVAAAFGFGEQDQIKSGPTEPARFQISEDRAANTKVLKVVGLVLAGIVAFSIYSCGSGTRRTSRPAPPPKRSAPTLQLANGAEGRLREGRFAITSQAVVEVGRVGRRYDAREYYLRGDGNTGALLIQAMNGAAGEWHLFGPVAPPREFAAVPPYAAAARKTGATVTLAGQPFQILHLFLSKPGGTGGQDANREWPAVQYGFVARQQDDWLIARWTESRIQFHRGRVVPESEVLDALGAHQSTTR